MYFMGSLSSVFQQSFCTRNFFLLLKDFLNSFKKSHTKNRYNFDKYSSNLFRSFSLKSDHWSDKKKSTCHFYPSYLSLTNNELIEWNNEQNYLARYTRCYNSISGFYTEHIVPYNIKDYYNVLEHVYRNDLVKDNKISLNAFDRFCYDVNCLSNKKDEQVVIITKDLFLSSNFHYDIFIDALKHAAHEYTYKMIAIDLEGIPLDMINHIIQSNEHNEITLKSENASVLIDHDYNFQYIPSDSFLMLDNNNSF